MSNFVQFSTRQFVQFSHSTIQTPLIGFFYCQDVNALSNAGVAIGHIVVKYICLFTYSKVITKLPSSYLKIPLRLLYFLTSLNDFDDNSIFANVGLTRCEDTAKS